MLLRQLWRRYARKKSTKTGLVVAGIVLLAVIMVHKQTETAHVDATAYTPLLNTIAKGESNGNYNAYFGNADNNTVRFTDMSVAEVLQWQDTYIREGSRSSAVGKYQIIRSTLSGLVQQLGIDVQARFDEAMQDRMAIALLERRGALAYVQKEMTREQFAANLAKEWAALPRVVGDSPEESYYAHDGLNKSRIGIEEVFAALATLESKSGL